MVKTKGNAAVVVVRGGRDESETVDLIVVAIVSSVVRKAGCYGNI